MLSYDTPHHRVKRMTYVDTWTTIKTDEQRLVIFEKKVSTTVDIWPLEKPEHWRIRMKKEEEC